MFQNLGQKISKEFILCLGLGLLAAIIGSFAVISFVMPAEYWGGGISANNQQLLKMSLGIKAYGGLEVFKFLDSALPSSAGIYRRKAVSAQFADSLYLDKDRLGSGLVMTADGWIVSNKTVIDSLGAKGLAVAVKGKIYNAEMLVFDTWTDTVFIKIGAENLPVVALGDSDSIKLGDVVYGGSNKNDFWVSFVSGVDFYPKSASKSDLILSSEKFSKRIKLQDKSLPVINGGLVAASNGDIVGLIISELKGNFVLPINYFKKIVSDVLKNKKILRPYFGVSYIDLNSALGAVLPNSGNGAYIHSVAVGSPAAKFGLRTGDIITGADDEKFNKGQDLSEIISEYKPGDKINIKIVRDGKETNIDVVLGGI